ncbi:MAG: hypothetical protein AUK37_00690 [Rhodobacterales bacterium CG2_30_65_12]|nr:MAG: hypothetical protein AUK37_00690 [Rhodobacterales bacterium CG2_30_65_12]
MYRYLERAENTARLIEPGQRIALTRLGSTVDEWRSVLQTADACDGNDLYHDAKRLKLGHPCRIEADDPYNSAISEGWGEALRRALDSLPRFEL